MISDDTEICPNCGCYTSIDPDVLKKDTVNRVLKFIFMTAFILIPIVFIGIFAIFRNYEDPVPKRSTSDLPYAIDYNGTDIYYLGSEFYQSYDPKNHLYSLYMISRLDVSALDDNQIFWLRKSDMNVDAYLSHKKNDISYSSMSYLGDLYVTNEDVLYVVFISSFSHENRYPFLNASISLDVEIELEHDYTPDPSDDSNVTFRHKVGETIPDVDQIDSFLVSYISEWLDDLGDWYEKLYSYLS